MTAVLAAPFLGKAAAIACSALPARRPLTWRETACPACGAAAGPWIVLPFLGGRCRGCGAIGRWRFPVLEAIVTAQAVWASLVTPGPAAVIATALGAWLLLLAVLDIEHLWLPLRLTAPLVVFGLALGGLLWPEEMLHRLAGAAGGYGVFALLAFGYRRLTGRSGLGGGDAWLAAAAGAWTGWQGLPLVVLLAASGALVGALTLLVTRGRRAAMRPAPFGAWLCAALWLVVIYSL